MTGCHSCAGFGGHHDPTVHDEGRDARLAAIVEPWAQLLDIVSPAEARRILAELDDQPDPH